MYSWNKQQCDIFWFASVPSADCVLNKHGLIVVAQKKKKEGRNPCKLCYSKSKSIDSGVYAFDAPKTLLS
jgi:hypothetical protein